MTGTDTLGDTLAVSEVQQNADRSNSAASAPAGSMDIVEPAPSRGKFRNATILIALNLALFVAALNQTLLANAVPTIASEFNSAAGYVWIGGAGLLASAATAPIWAKFSDIWGRKPITIVSLLWFFLSTLLCALSINMEMLIAGRVLQGIASGGLLEMVLIIISDIFSMRLRSLFIGLLEAMWAIAGALGPTLGGIFTQLLSWRYCFWINLPICGISMILLLLFLDVHNPRTKMADGLKAIDWLGSVSIVGIILMVLLGLDFGGVIFPWNSPKVICLIIFGGLLSVFFYISELRWAKYPVVPLHIFKSRSNVASFLVTFFQGITFMGAEYYLPLYFQSVKGASPLRSGILLVPTTVIEALAGIVTGVVIHRTGRYLELVWIGTLVMTLGNGLYISLGVDSSVGVIVAFQIVTGLGVGLLFSPPLIAVQACIAQDDIATASGAMGTVRNIATAMSIVLGGVVFQNGMALRATTLEDAGLTPDLVDMMAGKDAAANVYKIGLIPDADQQQAVREAFSWSMRNMWIMYTCVAFLAVVSTLFIERHVLSHEHTETRTGLKDEKSDRPAPEPAAVA